MELFHGTLINNEKYHVYDNYITYIGRMLKVYDKFVMKLLWGLNNEQMNG